MKTNVLKNENGARTVLTTKVCLLNKKMNNISIKFNKFLHFQNDFQKKTAKSLSAGFTLIEMIVAVFIFSIVVTVAAGAILSIMQSNKKTQSFKSVVNNLNIALETMVRDLRYNLEYSQYQESNSIYNNGNCPSVNNNQVNCTIMNGSGKIGYSLQETNQNGYYQIVKFIDNVVIPITAEEVKISYLNFTAVPQNNGKPRILINVAGMAGSGETGTDFHLQTTVTKR